MTQEQKIRMGLRVRDVRKQRGLSAMDMAGAVGVTAATLCCVERGSCPKLEVMVSIADVLDVSMDYLVRGIIPEQRRWGVVFHDEAALDRLRKEYEAEG